MVASAGKSDPKSSSCQYIRSDKLSGDGFERYDWRRESGACSGHQLLAESEVCTRPPRRRSVHPCFFFFFSFLFIIWYGVSTLDGSALLSFRPIFNVDPSNI
uniref:Uncharacterized protein n=1 Tax=Opuntia streptacantha TaxID=393608 RepID=A0A7C8Z2K1_OPUST